MKITDVAGQPVSACASFEYKSLTISASTVFHRWADVRVFQGDTCLTPRQPLRSVSAAIRWVERYNARQRRKLAAPLERDDD